MKNRIQDSGFRIQDSGFRIQGEDSDVPVTSDLLHPASSIPNPDVLKRVQWRCRRGLLELDIFLQPFVAKHYAGLNESELVAFDALLDMPDNTLWDMMTGRLENGDAVQSGLLEKIKSV